MRIQSRSTRHYIQHTESIKLGFEAIPMESGDSPEQSVVATAKHSTAHKNIEVSRCNEDESYRIVQGRVGLQDM